MAILSLLTVTGSCGTGNEKNVTAAVTSERVSETMTVTEERAPETTTSVSTVTETAESVAEAPKPQSSAAKLTNKMTEFERAYITKRGLTLTDGLNDTPDVRLENVIVTKEASEVLYRNMLKKGVLTEEEYRQYIADAVGYSYNEVMINGVIYDGFTPPENYDGGRLDYAYFDELTFENKEEYYDWLLDYYLRERSPVMSEAENYLEQTKAVFDAVINGTYTVMPDRYESFERLSFVSDPLADLSFTWEYDKDALESIRDRIEEYSVYDEQLGVEFIVHVTLPPHYDSTKTYPVFFMTDGVWRLNDHAALYKAMERGEAADVILVSLGFNYNIKNTDNFVRFELFISHRAGLLDFITDDLMPFLCENYRIDCTSSALFGHSMGGVFSHYALFCSDKYENQPFGRYIIGSPALFNLYDSYLDLGAEDAVNDYGYFDRHDSLDKKVFLCGGSMEDPDYADQYNGHDSTLEGLRKMNDRLAEHNADLTYRLYESHHYQYIPDMLMEYLKEAYPAD
ncbi:MAG: hypothetical protein K5876_07390 [Ruminiclostridium sp.]|nr:hypothetical protein [Ruminiclostridium sp.]